MSKAPSDCKQRCMLGHCPALGFGQIRVVKQSLRRAQGHFHLSHNYVRSISVSGTCAFVQTGVIGECNRDGFRHSRLLRGALASVLLPTCGPLLFLACCREGLAAMEDCNGLSWKVSNGYLES
jgi:hypothetical protein